MSRNPNEELKENDYIFEVCGEITVPAYSEEDAKERMKNEAAELIEEAIANDELEV